MKVSQNMFKLGDPIRFTEEYCRLWFDVSSYRDEHRDGFVSRIDGKWISFYSPKWAQDGYGHSGDWGREFFIDNGGHWLIEAHHLEHIEPAKNIEEFL